jgi:hypothetical protein
LFQTHCYSENTKELQEAQKYYNTTILSVLIMEMDVGVQTFWGNHHILKLQEKNMWQTTMASVCLGKLKDKN